MMTATRSYTLLMPKIVNGSAKVGRYLVCLYLTSFLLSFPSCILFPPLKILIQFHKWLDSVLSAPQILGVPLLLLANKQDSPQSFSVDEIRHDYEDWYQRKSESARRISRYGEGENETTARRQRIASLDVMGISALEG